MELELQQIFDKVRSVIEYSVGLPATSISPEHTLFDQLGIDSIDMVDILFELETAYDVELKISDVEKRALAESDGVPYEEGGVLTDAALQSLRRHMPEVDPAKFQPGLTVHQLVQLFTVLSLCRMIQHKIQETGRNLA